MRIEPKAAFYNEETGAVQPWKDIEVTDSVGNALVSEGLAIAIAEGGGGGGTGTMWHVVVNSVAVEGNYLNVNKAEDTDDYGTFYVALPAINDVPYSSISVAMDDGIENLTIGYMVADVASDVHPIITIAYDASIAVNATGDIAVTHDEYDFICTITGDGTITITEA